MTRLWESVLARKQPTNVTLEELLTVFSDPTRELLSTSWGNLSEEEVVRSIGDAYRQSGPVFALCFARMQVFSQARFQWTRASEGTPTDLFGSRDLAVLENPWPGARTSSLLSRMEVDDTQAGNAFVRRLRRGAGRQLEDRLVRLRPQWTTILMGSQEDAENPWEAADVEVLGYVYRPNGDAARQVLLDRSEVAHYAPVPDPVANFRGQSWVTPSLTTVRADDASEVHRFKFFENAAPQPLDAKVLTPTGWTTMGAVSVGDEVIGVDGKPHEVVGVYPQGERDIFRVHFTDGASTECTEDHVWRVASAYDRKKGTHRVLSLAQLRANGLRYESGPAKWSVPLVEPVHFEDAGPLPVDPYLMGLLLGDGSFRSNGKGSGGVTLAVAAADADETQAGLNLPDGVEITRRDRGGWSEFYFRGPGGPRPNPLTTAIRDLDLGDVPGHEKFIPGAYLHADVADRVALLQGLIDSDGHVASTAVRFTTTSRLLAEGLAELVGSLGGTTSTTEVDRGFRPQWAVLVKRLPDGIVPARLARKVAEYRPISRVGRYRYIDRVEYVGRKPAQCIRVDSADHLYVTDDHVVTHNTPNLAIKFDPTVTIDQVKAFKALLETEHQGHLNAYRTLYLGGGADPIAVGKDFRQMAFDVVQAKGETRLAANAGVPSSWVGFSEGLKGSALNDGNYNASRRRFADGTVQFLWEAASTALEVIVDRPSSRSSEAPARLVVDPRSVPFLREDMTDQAAALSQDAQTIASLVREGYEPDSVVAAVRAGDWSLLRHTGRVSVQLQTPGESPSVDA